MGSDRNDLENIGDIIETNLVTLGIERIEEQVTISETTEVLSGVHSAVKRALEAALQAVTRGAAAGRPGESELGREVGFLQKLRTDQPDQDTSARVEP